MLSRKGRNWCVFYSQNIQ